MSCKTLLVHLNDEHRLPAQMAAATSIAQRNGAHLIGLSVMPPIIVVPGGEGTAGAVIEEHRDAYRAEVVRMHDAFEAAVKAAGIPAEFKELDCQEINPFGDVRGVVVGEARNADLVIVGQSNPEWLLSSYLDVDEAVVLESGRPVLIVPRTAQPKAIGSRVMVAWDGSREATRAVHDALPLLVAADYVGLLAINPDKADVQRLGDISTSLKRHGVTCGQLQQAKGGSNPGALLLETAAAGNCDLLVMGCYGHSRLREFVFGGASRHVMEHMTMPVLMSH